MQIRGTASEHKDDDIINLKYKNHGRNLHTYTVLQTEVYVLRIRIRCAAFLQTKICRSPKERNRK